MKYIDPSKQSQRENYRLLTSTVIPRPIAFVTSQNEAGTVNAAPFSFFNVVASSPPLIAISVGRRDGKTVKDTGKNILENQEFVVHIVDEAMIQQVDDAAAEFPSNVSEVEQVGLTLSKSKIVSVPSIQEAKVRMECRLHKAVPLGLDDRFSTDLLIGEVVMFHIADEIYEDGRVLSQEFLPVGRLGTGYHRIGHIFSVRKQN